MEVIDEPSRAYLIPEYETDEELDWNCDDWFPQIFVEELNNWCRDTDLWPKGRSWKEFQRWFSWTWYPMAIDTESMHPDIVSFVMPQEAAEGPSSVDIAPSEHDDQSSSVPDSPIQLMGGYEVTHSGDDWLEHLFNAAIGEAIQRVEADPPEDKEFFWVNINKLAEIDIIFAAGQLVGKSSLDPMYLLGEYATHWDQLSKKLRERPEIND